MNKKNVTTIKHLSKKQVTTIKHPSKKLQTKLDLSSIPVDPGIYKMLDITGTIIYIGKAKNLKKRVQSYFSKDHKQDYKTYVLVQHIHDIEFIVTKNEDDALVLENQLIKHHQPKYNIQLKDDKTYPYIKLTKETFPRIIITRHKDLKTGTYFGPYPHLGSSRKMIRLLYDLFPLRDCTQTITLKQKQSKCINVDIGKCIGPCIYKDRLDDYQNTVKDLKLFLSGKNNTLQNALKQKMKLYSSEKRYEDAARIRDKLYKIEQLLHQRPGVELSTDKHIDFISSIKKYGYYYMIRQQFIEGKLLYQEGRYAPITSSQNEPDFIEQSILSLYAKSKTLPDSLCTTTDIHLIITQRSLLKRCKIEIPKQGKKQALLDMSQRNALSLLQKVTIKQHTQTTQSTQSLLENIQETLDLSHIPHIITGFDVSHYSGKNIVASAVTFKNTKPLKRMYRKFIIKGIKTGKSNDPKSMFEVVQRHLKYLDKEGDPLPNLILIDGGIPQLNACKRALQTCQNTGNIACISLAKREEEIYLQPSLKHILKLKNNNPVLHILQQIRDESHRFALTFQRKKRQEQWKDSPLYSINGLGKNRIQTLYTHFKTLDNIKQASIKDISEIPGFSKHLAQKITVILQS